MISFILFLLECELECIGILYNGLSYTVFDHWAIILSSSEFLKTGNYKLNGQGDAVIPDDD